MAAGAMKLGFPSCSPSHRLTPLPSPNRGRKSSIGLLRRRAVPPRPISSSPVEERLLEISEPEARLVDCLLGIQGRGRSANPSQLKDVERAVKVLEEQGGVPDPTSSSLIEGRWQLIFTTRSGTASPIQRTFVGVDFFSVFQEIYLKIGDPRVSNIVLFSDAVGELKVEAEATVKDGNRILFRFDQAAFSFKFLPFKIPYPVPFRLLGDEAKGWLDTTYLSCTGNIRISRGNKGTTFVLQKKTEPRQKLLSSISIGKGVEEIIDELLSQNQKGVDEEFELLQGKWQLIWASQLQMEEESWSETAATGIKGLQIIKKNGQLENVVDLFTGIKVCAKGEITRSSCNNYHVMIDNGVYKVGSLEFPLAIKIAFNIELLYADNKIRITRGFNQIISVHLRIGDD